MTILHSQSTTNSIPSYPITKKIQLNKDDPYYDDHIELLKSCYVQEQIDGFIFKFGINSKIG